MPNIDEQLPLDPRNDNRQWLQQWRDNAPRAFHQLLVNPLLPIFWPQLNLAPCQRVLVPLCGKSLDMLWLAERGHEVIGIELSPVAVAAFFKENQLKVKKQRVGKFIRWRAGSISIWCGDFFALTTQHLGFIDAVFDRAALTALPPTLHGPYLAQLMRLTRAEAPILLFTIEDIDNGSQQAAEPIDQTLVHLCAGSYSIELLYSTVIKDNLINATEKSYAKVYRLLK